MKYLPTINSVVANMFYMRNLIIGLTLLANTLVYAEMSPLNDESLSNVSGEGIGAALENLAIYSSDINRADAFKIRLTLDNKEDSGGTINDISDDDYWLFSELRLNKAGEEPGSANSGGRFGSYLSPIFAGDLKLIEETYSTFHNNESYDKVYSGSVPGLNNSYYRSFTANYTALPGSNESQINLSLSDRASNGGNYLSNIGFQYDYERAFSKDFFDDTVSLAQIGNFNSVIAAGYFDDVATFENRMDIASDKFDLHLRIDTFEGINPNPSFEDSFLSSVDINGFRLYGTELLTWVHDSKMEEVAGQTGVYMPSRGLSFASRVGFRAESIVINASPPDFDKDRGSYKSGELRLNDVDIYLPMGTIDQPMTISTVNVTPYQRYGWAAGTLQSQSSTQLRIDIAALPEAAKYVSERGNIFVGKMSFGDEGGGKANPLWTGKQNMPLRDENGLAREVVSVDMYAFKPRTYSYNEEIAKYNTDNPATPLPYIPNENLIEIKGIEIQRLVITTQDLN
jgi:hypothetical protein